MNFGHRRGLELVELAATPERPKRFFAGEVGRNRVEGKMGLCARAQLYGLHDWTRARCGVSAPADHVGPAPKMAHRRHESPPEFAAHGLQRIPGWRVRWHALAWGAAEVVQKKVFPGGSAATGAGWRGTKVRVWQYVKFLTSKEIFGRGFRFILRVG
jgi:hypothetical protein